MKLVLLIAALMVCLCAATPLGDQWMSFRAKYNKQYVTPLEARTRYRIFKDNMEIIRLKNEQAKALGSDTVFGVTEFADMTPQEFREKMFSKTPAPPREQWPSHWPVLDHVDIPEDLPTSFDWRPKGAVTAVKNQGQCGSCWSFSATGNMEGQWFLAGNTLVGLSEQFLVDCDHHCMEYQGQKSCDAGCDGGLQPNAFDYTISYGGIDSEASYPYTAADGTCHASTANIAAKISNFTMIPKDEDAMAAYLVAHGPLAIAADAAEWQFYLGGVFDLPCGTSLDHGILIVGYNKKETILGEKEYWIVKNSWGGSWGEEGYIYLRKGDDKCGCANFVSSSIV